MHVCARVCAGAVITAFLVAFVLGFGYMWFIVLHDGADVELGWTGLYGTLTLFVACAAIAGCAQRCGWGRQRVVLPVHEDSEDE